VSYEGTICLVFFGLENFLTGLVKLSQMSVPSCVLFLLYLDGEVREEEPAITHIMEWQMLEERNVQEVELFWSEKGRKFRIAVRSPMRLSLGVFPEAGAVVHIKNTHRPMAGGR